QGMAFAKRLVGFSSRRAGAVEAVDVGDLVLSAEKLLRRVVGENIEFVVRCGAPGSVFADRAGLERVVVNLVAHARGRLVHGGRISVAAASTDVEHSVGGLAAGPYVAIQVSDTGPWLDPERRAHAFDGDGSDSVLAVARAYAEEAGGRLAVDSAPGLGTTVVLYLPRVQAAGTVAPAAAPGQA